MSIKKKKVAITLILKRLNKKRFTAANDKAF